MMQSQGRRKPMSNMTISKWLGLLLVAGCLVCPDGTIAQAPLVPFGQSNTFVLNTNSIGFGDTAIMMISGTPGIGRVPAAISLGSLMPNPFNPRITISFNVGRSGPVELNIYDLVGRRIKDIVSQQFEVGQYDRQWDGRDNSGSIMPAGVYLVRIKSETTTDSKKITLVK